jgi:hypothetical protein
MFIIVSGYTDTLAKKDLSIEERMKRTLMTSGLAITVTSVRVAQSLIFYA